jgi:hypothetical protein
MAAPQAPRAEFDIGHQFSTGEARIRYQGREQLALPGPPRTIAHKESDLLASQIHEMERGK